MANVLVINATSFETRVALVEDGRITEYYVERKREKGIVGNIYKGRVLRVLPGMQAAFVDLGIDKAGFLYVNDVCYDPEFSAETFDLTEGEWEERDDLPDDAKRHLEAAFEGGVDALSAEAAAAEEDEVEEGEEAQAGGDEAAPGEDEFHAAADLPSAAEAPPSPEAEANATDEAAAAAAAGSASSEATEEADRAAHAAAADEAEVSEAAPPEQAVETARAVGTEGTNAGLQADASTEDAAPPESGAEAEIDAEVEAAAEVVEDAEAEETEEAAEDVGAESEEEAQAAEEQGAEEGARAEPEGEAEEESEAKEASGAARGRKRRRRRRAKTLTRSSAESPRVRARRERRSPSRRRERPKIQDVLKEGQEIVVQVAKAPIGSKGARITTHISLPGRHLVFMPTVDHVGISRRIASDKERRRLRQIIEEIRPPGTGFIVRTVAEGIDREKLIADARFLLNLWADINKRKDRVSAPALLHPDLDLILRATRDLFSEDVEKLIIDDPREYERVKGFVETHLPTLRDKVERFQGKEPIFDAYGIEDELRRAQQRKVWLKSGGYLVIDQAEALTAIDVNSGRYIGKKDLEETITKINIEAAEEIVHQLRLRNIGGIIILDFIDMEKSSNREKVYKALERALRQDKAKSNILKISELGLVEMTRKRVRESLTRMMNEPCPYCDGSGLIKTTTTVAYAALRDAMREAMHRKEDTIFINCNPEVAALLTTVEREALGYVMDRTGKKLVIRPQENYHREQYDLYTKNTATGAAVVTRSTPPAERPRVEQEASSSRGGRRRRRRRGGRGRKAAKKSEAEQGSE